MSRYLTTVLFALFAALSTATAAEEHPSSAISLATGEPGSESFVFATELWAMSQIALKPEHGIDLSVIEVADEGERLALLRDAEIEVALVRNGVPTSLASQMRTVLAFWPETGFASGTEPAQLLARKEIADDIVYRITKAIFENPGFFKGTAETRFGVADRYQATVGADLPIHPGAARYYDEINVGFSSRSIGENAPPKIWNDAPSAGEALKNFTNFDDAALNDEERSQIIAACKQALELGALSLVLGDLSSKGCEVYQSDLEGRKDGKHHDIDASDTLFDSEVGQGGPAVALDDTDTNHQAPAIVENSRRKLNDRQPTM